jgi:predicted nicotinamide N-methyase
MSFRYELKRQREKIGPIDLEIECLKDLNQTIDDLFAELERTGNASLLEELCPYFGTVWPSARALGETLVERKESFAGKRILEVGCGLAIPSLVAAKLGAEVVATDFHPEVPRFLESNLAINQVHSVRYERVDWSKGFPELGRFDWVIGSDILYERQHALLLARVVSRYMSHGNGEGGRALITDPARPYLQAFLDEMTQLGARHETTVRTAEDRPVSKDIFVVELCRS